MASNKSGYSDVLIGLQYGDEGKAKIVDALAPNYDIVARFNGGVNAGHTIVTNRGTLALRQVPSAVEYPQCSLYIGSGCVVSPAELVKEIAAISAAGFDISARLKISPHATLVLPHHIILDRMHGGELGTTGNGIGPAYADRAFRLRDGLLTNIKIEELLVRPEEVVSIAKSHLDLVAKSSDELENLGKELIQGLQDSIEFLISFIAPSRDYLVEKLTAGAKVLFEGAQSYMLDVVHGDVPYVTSSHTGVSAAYVGGDAPPSFHRHAFGIVKLVMSRVGRGPFPSEFGGEVSNQYCTLEGGKTHTRDYEKKNFNPEDLMKSGEAFKVGQALRMFSGEYGTGSGRPRRIGMLDLAQLRAAVLANGINSLFLTKCDCLREFSMTPNKQIPIVTHYEADSKLVVKFYPAFDSVLEVSGGFEKLPVGLKEIISDIEEISAAQVMGVGVGPHRNQLIMKTSL